MQETLNIVAEIVKGMEASIISLWVLLTLIHNGHENLDGFEISNTIFGFQDFGKLKTVCLHVFTCFRKTFSEKTRELRIEINEQQIDVFELSRRSFCVIYI